MKRKYILFIICSFFLGGVSAQTLEQARTLFTKGDYEQPNPYFRNMPNLNHPMVTTAIGTVSAA